MKNFNLFSSMDVDGDECIGNNRPQDVDWLCRLSVPELDMLIFLKKLVIQRAKIMGSDELGDKFNLKMLRALGFIHMEIYKGRMKDLLDDPSFAEWAALFDGCNLLNSNPSYTISIEELKACIELILKSLKRKDESIPSSTLVGANKDGDTNRSNSSMSL